MIIKTQGKSAKAWQSMGCGEGERVLITFCTQKLRDEYAGQKKAKVGKPWLIRALRPLKM